MPRKQSADEGDGDIALRMIELLKDKTVMKAFKEEMFPQTISNKLDLLAEKITHMSARMEEKEQRIDQLETKVEHLEIALDSHERYSRRANLRINGIWDEAKGKIVDDKVLTVVNDNIGFHPPIQSVDLERCHRLGRPVEGQGRPITVIVRFNSERLRDQIYRSRGMLKGFNATNDPDKRIYLNEDLTTKRSKLVYKMRLLKKAGNIMDVWTSNGRILIKNNNSRIEEVTSKVLHPDDAVAKE